MSDYFIRICILLRVDDITKKSFDINELPVRVKKVTSLTNSAIDERIMDVHEY